ncbi:MAG: DUF4878 domain-containing protein [Bacteroidetes bacterium]|nr:DUF4878 domain-containing protein [Bacteroidota bacterium]MBS1756535.1 DUF4878 domain-containing protein [Bacteroidota bacterium]
MKIVFLFLLSTLFLFSCNNKDTKRPQTAMDTGRAFIRASLDGDFTVAESLLLKDTQNVQLFESYKSFYGRLPANEKNNYKTASYEINKYLDVDDSTAIINYSNSFMQKPLEIKLVRNNKTWWVDFKYTSAGNVPIQ